MRRTLKSSLGFSLLELMISAAIGAVLIVTAADLFSRAMKASWITSQKSELQQDFRAASNLLRLWTFRRDWASTPLLTLINLG